MEYVRATELSGFDAGVDFFCTEFIVDALQSEIDGLGRKQGDQQSGIIHFGRAIGLTRFAGLHGLRNGALQERDVDGIGRLVEVSPGHGSNRSGGRGADRHDGPTRERACHQPDRVDRQRKAKLGTHRCRLLGADGWFVRAQGGTRSQRTERILG